MKVGIKSLLWGAHHFFLHPLTVYLAWLWLYKSFPTWREALCIGIHDWGYALGCDHMDDSKGRRHPEWAAGLMERLFYNPYYRDLCLYHSRHYAYMHDHPVSKLYYADKLSFVIIPACVYLLMTRASGELQEYRVLCDKAKQVPIWYSDWQWHKLVRNNMIQLAKDPKAVGYLHN